MLLQRTRDGVPGAGVYCGCRLLLGLPGQLVRRCIGLRHPDPPRLNPNPYTYPNTNSDPNCYTYTYPYAYSYTYGDPLGHPHSDSHPHVPLPNALRIW